MRQVLEDRLGEKIKEAGKQFPGRDERMWCFGFSTWSTREITKSNKDTAGDEVDHFKRPDSAVSVWVRSASQSSAAPTLERLPSDTSGGTHAAPRAAGGSRVSSYDTDLGALACNYM